MSATNTAVTRSRCRRSDGESLGERVRPSGGLVCWRGSSACSVPGIGLLTHAGRPGRLGGKLAGERVERRRGGAVARCERLQNPSRQRLDQAQPRELVADLHRLRAQGLARDGSVEPGHGGTTAAQLVKDSLRLAASSLQRSQQLAEKVFINALRRRGRTSGPRPRRGAVPGVPSVLKPLHNSTGRSRSFPAAARVVPPQRPASPATPARSAAPARR